MNLHIYYLSYKVIGQIKEPPTTAINTNRQQVTEREKLQETQYAELT
jgi:hypothetical protein